MPAVVQRSRERRKHRQTVALFSQAENMWRTEIERLRERVAYEEHRQGRIGTHSRDCYAYGPSHYECALRRIERLEVTVEAAMDAVSDWRDVAVEARAALRQYACDGECANCYGPVQDTKHCGKIARAALGEEE